MAGKTHYLILLRHGESDWNQKNLFTGWVDVKLSEKGRVEAERAGELLAAFEHKPDVLYTSRLSRAIQTANIALDKADRLWIDTHRSWRLNERHYGKLQGKNKKEIAEEFGNEQFMTWRRSFDVPPPPIDDDDKYSQVHDERYALVPNVEEIPRTESLKIVIDRFMPYWTDTIAPELLDGKTVLVAAHGNSLRGLVKHLDSISDDKIAGLNIPTGIPLVYELDDNLKPIKPSYYLDPEAAEAGTAAVANQGK
ncbi:Phosphoglycerate mutase 1 [Ascosphaera apis ARSEF 7405]|uniref:Phosphoglycerate mutase n=1 Tax=Ascosphaera apis ARSEF 7405 TaxID=392613 RepID=A0A162IDC6_9EURO|nr:Phosphoglycerate mutase 1 [Ascosphaera apis ARSEF 7405]